VALKSMTASCKPVATSTSLLMARCGGELMFFENVKRIETVP
jgi:hypothetical protein